MTSPTPSASGWTAETFRKVLDDLGVEIGHQEERFRTLAFKHGSLDDLVRGGYEALSEITHLHAELASARQEGKDEGLEEAAKILEGSDTNNVGMPHPHDVKVAAVIRSHKATGTPPAIPKEAEKGRIE